MQQTSIAVHELGCGAAGREVAMSLMQRAHDVLRASERSHPIARHEAAEEMTVGRAVDPNAPANQQAVQRMQQTHGNRFVQRLLQRNTGTEGDCPGGCL